ncbi:MAG TPA: hypothetical protein VLT90_13905 [Terriglobales bacterium]|nr:hypothetical protein [Terriglobales bacterium]
MFYRSEKGKPLPLLVLGLALLAVIGVAGAAFAQSSIPTKAAAPAASATVSGQHVAIDPATKQLRQPTAEEAKALADQMRATQSKKALKAVKHSNGSKSVKLSDQFMETMIVRINADGSLSEACVKTPDEAAAFLTSEQKKAADTKAKSAPAEEVQ